MNSPENYYDCLIIACLRRIQEWSYISVLAEFRQFTWPHKLFDFEQFIEVFHSATAVDLSSNVPDFITIHDSFKVCNVCMYVSMYVCLYSIYSICIYSMYSYEHIVEYIDKYR